MNGQNLSAWGASFPCFYIGVFFWGLGAYGQLTPNSNLLNPGHSPILVFGVLGLVFIAMGAGFVWLFSRKPSAPSQPTTEQIPVGTTVQAPNSRPLMRWVGRSGLWASALYIVFGICVAGAMLWATAAWALSSHNGWLALALVWGWGFAVWFIWIMRWAVRRVGPITLTMYAEGVSYTNTGATPTYIPYAEIGALSWWITPRAGQGGLIIRPRADALPEGSAPTLSDSFNQWYISALQFSNKQWAQIKENLGGAVMAAGGTVNW